MQEADTDRCVRLGTNKDAHGITNVYRQNQIDPGRFLELTRLRDNQSSQLELVRSFGGFISPPDDRDMQLTLQHGLVLVYVFHEEVLGYYRFVTRADKVFEELCAEFRIDQSTREFNPGSFENWSGEVERMAGKTLKSIRWVDREQAALAFNLALAGLQKINTGSLAWSVDVAVHPRYRGAGISRALVKRMHLEFSPNIRFSVFRIFEICKVNDTELTIENRRSANTFVNPASYNFAYTDEEIVLNSEVTLLVRWNYWLKHY